MFGKLSKPKFRGLTILEVAVLIVIVLIITAMVYPTLPKPDKMGPKQFTRSKLQRIEGRILDYYSDKKEWPDANSWEQQLRPYFARERFFSPEELVLDVWGKKIRYEVGGVGDHPQPFLYSCGPDGADDRGTNDDILIEVWRPKEISP